MKTINMYAIPVEVNGEKQIFHVPSTDQAEANKRLGQKLKTDKAEFRFLDEKNLEGAVQEKTMCVNCSKTFNTEYQKNGNPYFVIEASPNEKRWNSVVKYDDEGHLPRGVPHNGPF